MKIRLMLLAIATTCGALAVAAPVHAQPLPEPDQSPNRDHRSRQGALETGVT
jgi:hypothetical protein